MIPKWVIREEEFRSLGLGSAEDPLAEEHLRSEFLFKYLATTKSTDITNFTRKHDEIDKKLTILDLLDIPGYGHGRATCGKEIIMICHNCGKPFLGTASCNCRGCPEDWDKWAWKGANEGACVIWLGVRIIKKKLKLRSFRLHHVEVSVIVNPNDTLESLRELTYGIMKKHGFIGGSNIFHPYKKDSVTKKYTRQDGTYHMHDIGMSSGKWKMSQKDQKYHGREYVFKVNPDPCDKRRHRDKFFKTHDRCDCSKHYYGIRKFDDLKRIIHYELGHAGFIDRGHAVTYWGELANNKLSRAVIRESNPIGWDYYHKKYSRPCPECKSLNTGPDWDKMQWKGNTPLLINHEIRK